MAPYTKKREYSSGSRGGFPFLVRLQPEFRCLFFGTWDREECALILAHSALRMPGRPEFQLLMR